MRTILYFTSPTCSKCKIVERWLSGFVEENSWADFTMIDTSKSLDEARKYNVSSLPGFVLVDEDGQMIGKICGIPDKSAVNSYLTLLK